MKRKIPPAIPPNRVIGFYYGQLAPTLDAFRKIAAAEYLRQVPDIYKAHGGRMDANDDLLSRLEKRMLFRWDRLMPDRKAQKLAQRVEEETRAHSKRQLERTVRSVVGVSPILKEPKLLRASRAFSRTNSRLITTLGPDHLHRVNRAVRKAIVRGERVETLAKTIEGYFSKSAGGRPKNMHAAARLIARDQVLKHNAQVSRERHKTIGVNSYTWRTSDDSRVRDEHDALNGKVFEYGKSPIGLDPGEDYQCRCTAEPVIEGELLEFLLAS